MFDQSTDRLGFSRAELISLLAVLICLLTFAIPSFINWKKKSKSMEAQLNLLQIFDAEQLYFTSTSGYLALPPTPANPTSSLQQASFDQEPWSALQLTLDPNVYYSYEVQTKVEKNQPYFDAYARGDIDGDGHKSIFKIRGFTDPNGQPLGRDILYKLDPLE